MPPVDEAPVVPEVTDVPTEPQTEDEADQDFAAAFHSAQGTEAPPVEPETPTPVETPAEPVVEPAPKYVQITEQDFARLNEQASRVDQLATTLEKINGTAFGKIGGLERTLKELQGKTPAGVTLKVSEDDFSEMAQDFPELLKMTVTGLNRALSKVQGTGETVNVKDLLQAELPTITKTVKEDTLMTVMDGLEPDWRQVTASKPYTDWLNTQPADYRHKVLDSWDIGEVRKSIHQFREATKPAPAPAPKPARPNRAAATVVPRHAGGTVASARNDDDEFVSGWKSARGQ